MVTPNACGQLHQRIPSRWFLIDRCWDLSSLLECTAEFSLSECCLVFLLWASEAQVWASIARKVFSRCFIATKILFLDLSVQNMFSAQAYKSVSETLCRRQHACMSESILPTSFLAAAKPCTTLAKMLSRLRAFRWRAFAFWAKTKYIERDFKLCKTSRIEY